MDYIGTNMNQTQGVQVSVRLPPRTVEKIDEVVKEGRATNRADALRRIIDKGMESP